MEDDSPPPLDELERVGDDSYWMEDTTITVPRYLKAHLNDARDGRPWAQFLEQLRREHQDPLTLNDADDIADRVIEQLDAIAHQDGITESEAEELIQNVKQLRDGISEVEERTGRIERQLEQMEGRR